MLIWRHPLRKFGEHYSPLCRFIPALSGRPLVLTEEKDGSNMAVINEKGAGYMA
jgi:hypothetical protein